MIYKITFLLSKSGHEKKKFFFVTPFWKNRWWETTPIYMCMIFHKKFFQCVTAPRPLFLTPQKTCLLKLVVYSLWKHCRGKKLCKNEEKPCLKFIWPMHCIVTQLWFGLSQYYEPIKIFRQGFGRHLPRTNWVLGGYGK